MATFNEGFLNALRAGIWLSRETAAHSWERGKAIATEEGKTDLEAAMGLAEASYYQGFLEALEWILHDQRMQDLRQSAESICDANIVPPHQRN